MTLATKICLIDKGHLQQYEPPLKVYCRPKNLFVADFVGKEMKLNQIICSTYKIYDFYCSCLHVTF